MLHSYLNSIYGLETQALEKMLDGVGIDVFKILHQPFFPPEREEFDSFDFEVQLTTTPYSEPSTDEVFIPTGVMMREYLI